MARPKLNKPLPVKMIKVREKTHKQLKFLAAYSEEPIVDLLERIVEQCYRENLDNILEEL